MKAIKLILVAVFIVMASCDSEETNVDDVVVTDPGDDGDGTDGDGTDGDDTGGDGTDGDGTDDDDTGGDGTDGDGTDDDDTGSNTTEPKYKGTLLANTRTGVNFNNKYGDKDLKTDWEYFTSPFQTNFASALSYLEENTVDFEVYRIGFSRGVAGDDTNLATWSDKVKKIKDNGDKVIICLWGQNESIGFEAEDVANWEKVIALAIEKDFLDAVVGWELNNEPKAGSVKLAGYYNKVYEGVNDWKNIPVLLNGVTFAQKFGADLVNNVNIPKENLIWAVHAYPKFLNVTTSTTNRENYTPEEWEQEFIDRWDKLHNLIDGNYVVTELGDGNKFVYEPTTPEERRTLGFMRAANKYFGDSTTVFWYSGYNAGGIGLIDQTDKDKIRTKNINAIKLIWEL